MLFGLANNYNCYFHEGKESMSFILNTKFYNAEHANKCGVYSLRFPCHWKSQARRCYCGQARLGICQDVWPMSSKLTRCFSCVVGEKGGGGHISPHRVYQQQVWAGRARARGRPLEGISVSFHWALVGDCLRRDWSEGESCHHHVTSVIGVDWSWAP